MRKFFYIFSIISLFIFAGFGCKGLSSSEQAAIAPVKLTYWTVFGNVEELQKLAAVYKQMHPYVTIDIRQLRYEEFDKIFVNALADDVGPDIISMHTRWLGKYSNRLLSMPDSVKVANVMIQGKYQPQTIVTVEQNRMPTIDAIKSTYVAGVAEDVIVGGKVYGLPLTYDTLAILYNKDLLDKAGIPLPPSTWDELVTAVKKTTIYDKKGAIVQSGIAVGTGTNTDNVFDILSALMLQNGVVMSAGNQVTFARSLVQSATDQNPVLQSLRFYTDFARPTKEVYSWNDSFNNSMTEFARGKAAFAIGFAFDLARVKKLSPQLTVNAVPLPQLNPTSPVNVANYWVESVSKKTKHSDEAWDFIRFISSPDTIKRYSASLGVPSPLRVHIAAGKEDVVLSPFVSQILTAKNWYHGRDIDAATGAIKDLVIRYLAPYTDKESQNQLERDRNLVLTAAAIIQQTF